MAWEKLIVASRDISIPEIVAHERTGLVVPSREAGALREALLELSDEPGFGEQPGAAARREAELRFGVERMIEETASDYDEVVG